MKRIITILVIGLGLAALCAAQEQDNTQFGIFRQEGIASYYGKEFAGRPTASGELFDPSQLTAAHPTLPFGTMLRITNKHNNKQVVVRVNDRGPFVSARFLDVSQGAAEELGMISTGTAPVIAESLGQIAMATPAQGASTVPVVAPPVSTVPQDNLPVPAYQPPAAQGNAPVQPQAASQPVYQPQPVAPQPQGAPQSQTAPQPSQQPPAAQVASTQPPAQQPAAPIPAYQPPAPPVVLPPAEILPGMPPMGTNKTYRVQVGSFKVPRHAAEAFERLKSVGLNPAYERNGEYYRVVLSGVRPEEIQAMAEKLGVAGFREALVREER